MAWLITLQKGVLTKEKKKTEEEFNVDLFQTKAQHVMVKLKS